MATILLSAAGLALGGSIGGSVMGLSTAVIGRAAGAAVGRAIDARLLGQGSDPVDTGKVDRFRLSGAGEGVALSRVWGRARIAGHVIWAGPFVETVQTSGGGKGAPRRPQLRQHSYTVSLALALCRGVIGHVGRVWADGVEIARDDLTMQVYAGTQDQLPDPRITAMSGDVPAYRGLAYVVIEDLDLGRFGNRVPQFTFEVFRPAPARDDATAEDLAHLVRAVALIPGTGDYALATTPVFLSTEFGAQQPVNVNTVQGKTDLAVALDALTGELPAVRSVSLVVSWFGDDLRCGQCTVRPRAEQLDHDPEAQVWQVSGTGRAAAGRVAVDGGAVVYGGTPSDASVIEAITELRARGQAVMFYPFILMDQLLGNALPDPYGGAGQPPLPWRGRITLSVAPGRNGSPDATALADAQVAAFFGNAQPGHFAPAGTTVTYGGPAEWSFRRMILHYAHLCALAGGVDTFCIGSELRGLTSIRGASGFPAVAALCQLAAEVRVILPGAKITYAADWSEYHGYQPPGTADKLFHLDPLWAHPAIDVIGIDNYLPLSDWRDGDAHLDAGWGAIHNLDYLTANVAGGEYYDWFYHSDEARAAQIRTPIADGDHDEPWVWRQKDLLGWWSHAHHDRIGGTRSLTPTQWVPQSKPIWFTEMGCAAIDKGTNAPNKFLDPKSSESVLPDWSNGQRDDLIQMQYIRAMHRHFADPVANPISLEYAGRMVDMTRAHVWAWDARPFPAFPARGDLWTDGGNYARGHWLNGRAGSRTLDSVVREVCVAAGVTAVDTSDLYGILRGYRADDTDSARAVLQPLMVAHGFDAVERDGVLRFANRRGRVAAEIDPVTLARSDDGTGLQVTRAPDAETAGRVRLSHVAAEGDYAVAVAEAVLPDAPTTGLAVSEFPLVLTRAEARQIAERWLTEARVARDTARFALPPSAGALGAGDVMRLTGDGALWRIDRIEDREQRVVDAVRIEPAVYLPVETADESGPLSAPAAQVPVTALFMDLPLLTGGEDPQAPHLALTARPWPGAVALYASVTDSNFTLESVCPLPATVGTTQGALLAAPPGRWDRGPALRVRLLRGTFASVTEPEVLAGANLVAIGDGSPDRWELFQFAAATLVAPQTWDLSLRLRGQAGSDALMPQDWPAGSRVVLLDGAVEQIALPPGLRNVLRHYRWGPAERALDDPTYRAAALAFRGNGLRPYAPCHLVARAVGADLAISWIRRTRTGGDSWDGYDVPLAEDAEAYLLRVSVDGILRREVTVATPHWTYGAVQQAADGAGVRLVQVAQLSALYGPGPFRSLVLP